MWHQGGSWAAQLVKSVEHEALDLRAMDSCPMLDARNCKESIYAWEENLFIKGWNREQTHEYRGEWYRYLFVHQEMMEKALDQVTKWCARSHPCPCVTAWSLPLSCHIEKIWLNWPSSHNNYVTGKGIHQCHSFPSYDIISTSSGTNESPVCIHIKSIQPLIVGHLG